MFLFTNRALYTRYFTYNLTIPDLTKKSAIVKDRRRSSFLIRSIEKRYSGVWGKKKVKCLSLIYTPKAYEKNIGWKAYNFRKVVKERGPSLCIFKSSLDYVSAGFTTIKWMNPK